MTDNDTFRKDATIRWYRTKIDKAALKALTKRSDLRGFVQVFLQLGLFACTGTLAYLAFRNVSAGNWTWSVPLLLLALFAHGSTGAFVGLIAIHELGHKTPFKTRIINDFFVYLYSFISWTDCVWFRPSHVVHHRATVHNDYDGEVVLPQKLALKEWKFLLSLFAWNPQTSWAAVRDFWYWSRGRIEDTPGISRRWYEHVLPKDDEPLRRQHRNWARTVLYGHLALAALFIATGHWFLIVLFTFGTHYCRWGRFLCETPQHYGLTPNVPDFRICCRTYTCSKWTGFFYWNMQYHIEHHMYPAVPFYNLPKLRQALEHDLPSATHGVRATWRELLAIHRKVQQEPDYRFVPQLPHPAEDKDRTSDDILEREASLAGAS